MSVVLKVENICKSFGEKKVHQGITFNLHEGEILSLFGGSGSGKSLLLRSIIGLEKPDSGHIYFEDKDIPTLSEEALLDIRKKIGFVFQNGALFDSLTVAGNLAYPLKEHTKDSPQHIQEKINIMLDLVDMRNAADLLPNELSGGMQKRAGLARALMLEPKIILFDEPTAGLDPTNTRRLLDNILRLKETRHITGIFVTHDIPSALAIADSIAILYEGKIAIRDTVANIQASTDPLVGAFLNPEKTK